MSLDRSTVKEFADYLNGQQEKGTTSLQMIGTAVISGNDVSVLLDGCDTTTPVSTVLKTDNTDDDAAVSDGDRVLVLLQDNQATIIGNYGNPIGTGTQGPQGETGPKGDDGDPGEDGEDGVSVTQNIKIYYLATSKPSKPSSVITSTSTSANVWTKAIPTYISTSYHYYVCQQTQYSDGTFSHTDVSIESELDDIASEVNGLAIFQSRCADGSYVVINGGAIDVVEKINGGIKVKAAENSTNYTSITSSGVGISQSDTEVASFNSTTVELGKNSYTSGVKVCGGLYELIGDTNAQEFKITHGFRKSSRLNKYSPELNMNAYGTFEEIMLGLPLYSSSSSSWNDYISIQKGGTYNNGIRLSSSDGINLDGDITFGGDVTSNNDIDIGGYLYAGGIEIPAHLLVSNPTAAKTGTELVQNTYGYYVPLSTSARKYKKDIKPVENEDLDPHKLYDIEVVQFKYKEEFVDPLDGSPDEDLIGFIADQIDEVYPIAAVHNKDGGVENWHHRYLIPPMLKLIQEQHDEIELLKSRIDSLEAK